MINAIIRGNLGSFGSAILDFYIENALIINGIILIYGFCMFFAKIGFNKIIKDIKNELVKTFGNDVFTKNEKNFIKIVGRHQFDWESLAKATKAPIFSGEKALFFQIKSPENLSNYFTPEMIYSLVKQEPKPSEK